MSHTISLYIHTHKVIMFMIGYVYIIYAYDVKIHECACVFSANFHG